MVVMVNIFDSVVYDVSDFGEIMKIIVKYLFSEFVRGVESFDSIDEKLFFLFFYKYGFWEMDIMSKLECLLEILLFVELVDFKLEVLKKINMVFGNCVINSEFIVLVKVLLVFV